MGSKSGRHAKLNLRVKRRLSQLLSLAFLISLLSVPFFSESVKAATAGSGDCIQTVSTNVDVNVYASSGYCYIAFKNSGAVNSQATFTWTVPAGVSTVSALIVGGGGGGASRHGGGGGGADVNGTAGSATLAGYSAPQGLSPNLQISFRDPIKRR